MGKEGADNIWKVVGAWFGFCALMAVGFVVAGLGEEHKPDDRTPYELYGACLGEAAHRAWAIESKTGIDDMVGECWEDRVAARLWAAETQDAEALEFLTLGAYWEAFVAWKILEEDGQLPES